MRRGYTNPPHLRKEVADAHVTSLARTAATAVVDHITVIGLPLVVAVLVSLRMPAWVTGPAAALAVLVTGRQLRALECLVHEASHFNWSRKHRRANDVLATLIAVTVTGGGLLGYRRSHLLHHGRFGTADDPDRQRYEELGLEDLPRARLVTFIAWLARRFWAYQRGWFRSLGDVPWLSALPFAWAAALIITPAWLLSGPVAASAAGGAWIAGYLAALPAIRFVAESGEHVYRESTSVFDATVSNLGLMQRLIFHPHGDGYHTIHHLWPGIPHHRIARLHQILLVRDQQYATRLRFRTKVLSEPWTGYSRPRPASASSQDEPR